MLATSAADGCPHSSTSSTPTQIGSPYESFLRAIVYQSISGKVAAVIFSRIKALGPNGRCPSPEEVLRVRPQALRKAGLSAAKVAAVRDLAQKTMEGIVPALDEAHHMSDQEQVERLISVRHQRERRDQLTHPPYQKLELLVTAPNSLELGHHQAAGAG